MAKLPRSFYDRPTESVARDLLGMVLVRQLHGETVSGRIVEVEAYLGERDPGSHAYRGRTRRTEVMFGPPGHLYVYFTYGMHFCMNVVTEPAETAGAVLLRAAQPMLGVAAMERRRGPRALVDLCNGPAKLCQAFGITRDQNGADLEGEEIWIEDDGTVPGAITVTSRVGLSSGRDLLLRYLLADSPFVSPGRPSTALSTPTDQDDSVGRERS